MLNPNVELVLGPAMLTWDELESVVSLLEGPMPKVWQLDQAISAMELPFSRINRIRLRHQRLIVTPVSPMQVEVAFDDFVHEPESLVAGDAEDDDPQLLDLLLMSRGLGASDPRDKIYALLGLGKHDIDPDYSQSPESVFTDFALQTVGVVTELASRHRSQSLDLSSNLREVRRALILVSCAGRHNQKLELPSWVPDWTVSLSSRPLVFGLGHRFRAGGDKLSVFDWHPDFGFQLCGKLLDAVAVHGTVHLDHDGSSSSGRTRSSRLGGKRPGRLRSYALLAHLGALETSMPSKACAVISPSASTGTTSVPRRRGDAAACWTRSTVWTRRCTALRILSRLDRPADGCSSPRRMDILV